MNFRNLIFLIVALLVCTSSAISQTTAFIECEENDKKVEDFATFLQEQIQEQNLTGFMSKFNSKTIKNKVLESELTINKTPNDHRLFEISFKRTIEKITEKIFYAVELGNYYDLVNYRYDQETASYHILFRLFQAEEGINYHDYKVIYENDTLMFDDIYIYLSGEYIGDTIVRSFQYFNLQSLENSNNDVLQISKAQIAIEKGNNEEAYSILTSLSTELANEKFIYLFKILVASTIDETLYMEAMEDLKTNFKNDPTIYLTLIDYSLLKEEYDVAFDLIDNLQVETNDDFLYYLKGNVEYLRGRYEEANDFFNYIMYNYSDFLLAYFSSVSAYVQNEKFEDALTVLDALIEVYYTKQDLIAYVEELDENGTNELAALASSKIYKKWKRKK